MKERKLVPKIVLLSAKGMILQLCPVSVILLEKVFAVGFAAQNKTLSNIKSAPVLEDASICWSSFLSIPFLPPVTSHLCKLITDMSPTGQINSFCGVSAELVCAGKVSKRNFKNHFYAKRLHSLLTDDGNNSLSTVLYAGGHTAGHSFARLTVLQLPGARC